MDTVETIKYDYEIFVKNNDNGHIENHISIIKSDYKELKHHTHTNIYLKSTLFILVLNGKGCIAINFKNYDIKSGDILLLSFGHFFRIKELNPNFSYVSLYIERDFINEMYSTDMLYQRIKYGVKMFDQPILKPSKSAFKNLLSRINFIKKIKDNQDHHYQKEMILNTLRIYFLDLANTIENMVDTKEKHQLSREDIYFQKFLELLVQHYKTEHLVDFYASNINISTHYLTKIVKRKSGQTVSDFIYQLVYSDAKLLLQQPQFSIQEIALQLNFSDQSVFGKFFKRKNGQSPLEFRKNKK